MSHVELETWNTNEHDPNLVGQTFLDEKVTISAKQQAAEAVLSALDKKQSSSSKPKDEKAEGGDTANSAAVDQSGGGKNKGTSVENGE